MQDSVQIEAKKLNFIYGEGTAFEQYALKDVSFKIRRGEFVGIIGHTGSGKSTLIQHLNGLIKATSGELYFNGENIYTAKYDMKLLRQKVGLVFQYPEHQLFEVDVLSDVEFGPRNQKLPEEVVKERAKESLALVGLDESYYKKSPFELSGGQKRRVAIAGVLAMNPEVLILDEPTAGLDPMERIRFRNLIGQLSNDRIVLLSTHIVSDIEAIAKEVFVMKEGRIIDQGTIGELCRKLPCKVWIYREKTEEAESFVSRFVNPIGAIKTDGEYTQARILAEERPGENAICVDTTLEDVFLYHFGEIGGDSND